MRSGRDRGRGHGCPRTEFRERRMWRRALGHEEIAHGHENTGTMIGRMMRGSGMPADSSAGSS